jgi:hypothetical protein
VTPAPGFDPVALLVSGSADDPSVSCLSKYVQSDGTLDAAPVYQTPDEWGTVHVRGADIIPGVTYVVRSECQAGGPVTLSEPGSGQTWPWGDVEPNGVINFADVLLIAQAFQQNFDNVTLEAADIEPCDPNLIANFADMLRGVQAFQARTYADTNCPLPCP